MNLFILIEFGASNVASWPVALQQSASAIISLNDITPDHWWVYVLIIVGIIAGFRLLSILALARRAAAFF